VGIGAASFGLDVIASVLTLVKFVHRFQDPVSISQVDHVLTHSEGRFASASSYLSDSMVTGVEKGLLRRPLMCT